MAASSGKKAVLVLAGLGVGAGLAWLLGRRDDEAGWDDWFESEGVVRAGPEVDAPEEPPTSRPG